MKPRHVVDLYHQKQPSRAPFLQLQVVRLWLFPLIHWSSASTHIQCQFLFRDFVWVWLPVLSLKNPKHPEKVSKKGYLFYLILHDAHQIIYLGQIMPQESKKVAGAFRLGSGHFHTIKIRRVSKRGVIISLGNQNPWPKTQDLIFNYVQCLMIYLMFSPLPVHQTTTWKTSPWTAAPLKRSEPLERRPDWAPAHRTHPKLLPGWSWGVKFALPWWSLDIHPTSPKTNECPQNTGPFQKETLAFQSLFFRLHISFWGSMSDICHRRAVASKV